MSSTAIEHNNSGLRTNQVGKGNAEVALSLVGYDDEVQTAMEYVFGATFVLAFKPQEPEFCKLNAAK
ncbi:hypothetical protein L2E82_50081 [Cichorium intybus]|nr:hypothetical protein L2E82_50081 [Cichorium intybus]